MYSDNIEQTCEEFNDKVKHSDSQAFHFLSEWLACYFNSFIIRILITWTLVFDKIEP